MRRLRQAISVFSIPRRTLQMQLALFYAGLFCALGVTLLAITNGLVFVGSSSSAEVGSAGNPAPPVQHHTDIHQLAIISAVALPVTVVLSLLFGWLIAGRLLRPLRTITATARDISASNLHQRLALGGADDEFKELGKTLDSLFGRLEASFESQRRFVANASHELRTPLTAERALLQVALADPGASIDTLRSTCEEVLALGEQQERLIDALLTLASSERGVERWEPVDLADIAEEVVLVRRQEAERQGIHIEAKLAEAPTIGDTRLLESLMANLLDNALRYNVAGGWAEIVTAAHAGQALVSVRNTGSMVPESEIDRLFQPFQRLGDERIRHGDGHGLGLAIVHAIAHAHGATLSARARPEGGLAIEIRFPASDTHLDQPVADVRTGDGRGSPAGNHL
jgi:signal transduction histidine kinase